MCTDQGQNLTTEIRKFIVIAVKVRKSAVGEILNFPTGWARNSSRPEKTMLLLSYSGEIG